MYHPPPCPSDKVDILRYERKYETNWEDISAEMVINIWARDDDKMAGAIFSENEINKDELWWN